MLAILSDLHGNLEALRVVLEDASRQGVEAVYGLGNLVGYGPYPRECVDLAMQWHPGLMGNFDRAVLDDPPDVGPAATIATQFLVWSRRELNALLPDPRAVDRRYRASPSGISPL